MVDDCYHSCKFISRPPIGIGVQGTCWAATLCARGQLSPHDTEAEALNHCGDQSRWDDFGFSRASVTKRQTDPRDAIIKKKIFRSRLAGRHDTWQNQQWGRVLQRKIYLVGRIQVKNRSNSGARNLCYYESLRPIDSSSQSGNFLGRLNTTHSLINLLSLPRAVRIAGAGVRLRQGVKRRS